MTVFISYSHTDKEKVEKIAVELFKRRTDVWIDRWVLNVGDSILNKIQNAVQSSDAIVVALSKTSVESEWCKKELTAGLVRELDEKRVLLLPALLEDCEIPLF